MSKSYPIIKGVNRPLEFKGFQAQYIAYLGIGLLLDLALFTCLYFIGMPMLLNAGLCIALIMGIYQKVFILNKTFGQHGLMKQLAAKQIPMALKIRDRQFLKSLRSINETS
ncbi:DUF4133 domain-containing protein [Belliella sp. DSM 111904]|uniref:DUF4133 domain-containing protein n=1 Tax=Belliella filtrata TaxID=2923435 RepID=A0ABS9UXY6_9BACT|nr:DUF4133 domain-containing protein [Belliella filtrata]MCH7408979.1 DUF4133 domain-containing protein [Belliella filtrata]